MDALTGLLDRDGFHRSIQQRPDAWPNHYGMGVAFIDVVRMRAVNDAHGREAGDAALRLIGDTIPVVAPLEWASRYGGDEFGVVLTVTDVKEAEAWAEAARARIVARARAELAMALDVQIGIAVGDPGWWPADVLDEAIAPADAALYQAMHGEPDHGIVVHTIH